MPELPLGRKCGEASPEVVESMYNIYLNVGKRRLEFNLSSGACVDLGGEDASLDLMPHMASPLFAGGFLVSSDIDEYKLVMSAFQAARYDSSHLTTYVIPTQQCNFRCSYCYSRSDDRRMSEAIHPSVVLLLQRLSDAVSTHHVLWLGGEPLLALDTILHTEYSSRRSPSYRGVSTLITSGFLLTSPTAEALASVGLTKVVVTLDGPRDTHDRRRRLLDGRGSHDIILDNVCTAVEHLAVTLRVNVDKGNALSLTGLFEELEGMGLLGRLRVRLVPTRPLNARCQHFGCSCFDDIGEFLHNVEPLLELPRVTLGGILPRTMVCNALRVNDYVVGPAGELYKCPVEVGDRDMVIGDVFGGPARSALTEWSLRQPLLMDECRTCKVLPICISRCPRVSHVCAKSQGLTIDTVTRLVLHYIKSSVPDLCGEAGS